MGEIRCPKCGEIFVVDDSGYAAIVKQVRDEEFNRELANWKESLERDKAQAVALASKEAQAQRERELAEQKQKILQYRAELEKKQGAELAAKDQEIARLEGRLKNADSDRDLALTKAAAAAERELAAKQAELDRVQTELERKYSGELAQREQTIAELKGRLNNADSEKSLAIIQKTNEKEQEIALLQQKLENNRATYEGMLRIKDEELQQYKDFKARLSTKMIGESLEQHCEMEFNRLRATGFQRAYFEKDNDARTGSKGDYIFRDYDENGLEFISIMFEMKNQMDTTATKKKNEDFFRELDKDRREKKCEYAVLVSMLEEDSEFYNTGIVDVSHKYPKTYVIRPQFFIPIITLLRNAAANSLEYRRELQRAREQNIDIVHFEENMESFKEQFGRNYRLAAERFGDAIKEIDETIKHLEKVKEALRKSTNNLRLANNKAEELTIKRLTRSNPTMAEKFAEIRAAKKGNNTDNDTGGDRPDNRTRFEF